MLAQVTAISTSVSAPRTLIRFLFRVDSLMRVMLRLRRGRVIAEATLVLSLSCVRRLMILQLLLCAECATARF